MEVRGRLDEPGQEGREGRSVTVRKSGEGVLRFDYIRPPEPLAPVHVDTADGRLTFSQDKLPEDDPVALAFTYFVDAPRGTREVRRGEMFVDMLHEGTRVTCE